MWVLRHGGVLARMLLIAVIVAEGSARASPEFACANIRDSPVEFNAHFMSGKLPLIVGAFLSILIQIHSVTPALTPAGLPFSTSSSATSAPVSEGARPCNAQRRACHPARRFGPGNRGAYPH